MKLVKLTVLLFGTMFFVCGSAVAAGPPSFVTPPTGPPVDAPPLSAPPELPPAGTPPTGAPPDSVPPLTVPPVVTSTGQSGLLSVPPGPPEDVPFGPPEGISFGPGPPEGLPLGPFGPPDGVPFGPPEWVPAWQNVSSIELPTISFPTFANPFLNGLPFRTH